MTKKNKAKREGAARPLGARLKKLEKTLAATKRTLTTETRARKRAEDALVQAQAVFWSFVNQTPALVCLQDKGGRFVFCNGRITEVYGDRPEDLEIGRAHV